METCSKCGKEVENIFVVSSTADDKKERLKCLACFMEDHWKLEE